MNNLPNANCTFSWPMLFLLRAIIYEVSIKLAFLCNFEFAHKLT
uniref:Uncharacterized protein n=1 Tax=Anguilla anguilla TaxID=7936 RepID=A0A0E9RAF3_ANGAN